MSRWAKPIVLTLATLSIAIFGIAYFFNWETRDLLFWGFMAVWYNVEAGQYD